jgi:hypothetical protein
MKKILLIIVLVLFPVVSATEISEIFFDSIGSDNNKEFIELINASNLTIIKDSTSNDTLTLLQKTNSTYTLIVEEGFNYTNLNCTIYSAGATIGNNLNNDNDNITVYGNITVQANYSINDSFTEGQSYYPQENMFEQPTPCAPLQKINQTNTTTNTFCPTQFSVEASDYVIDDSWKFTFQLDPEPETYEITYWIETYIGDVAKSPRTTTNLNTKSFTPKTHLWYAAYLLNAQVETCNTTESLQKLFFYINDISVEEVEEEPEEKETSHASIMHVYASNSLEFGKPIKIKLDLKNIQSDSDVSLFLEHTKKTFSFFRDSEAVFTTELSLEQECTKSLNTTLILQAFNQRDEQELFIECPQKVTVQEIKKEPEQSQKETSTTQPHEINKSLDIPLTADVTRDILVFEDSSQKSQRMFPLILTGTGVLGTILLITNVKKIYK